MHLLDLSGDAHTQPATKNVKQTFLSPRPPLNRQMWQMFYIGNVTPN